MSSTYSVNPRLLADAITEAGCLDFKQVCRLAAVSAGVPVASRGLKKRVSAALCNFIPSREFSAIRVPAWQSETSWGVFYDSKWGPLGDENDGIKCHFSKASAYIAFGFMALDVAAHLASVWQRKNCTRHVDIYCHRTAVERLGLFALDPRQVSARLLLSQLWVKLACDKIVADRELRSFSGKARLDYSFVSTREAPLLHGLPKKLPDSDVVLEIAVIRTSDHSAPFYLRAQKPSALPIPFHQTAVIALVPTTHVRDVKAILRFFSKTLLTWERGSNDFQILTPSSARYR